MEDNVPQVPDPFNQTKPINVEDYVTDGSDVYWKFVDELEANFKSMIADARAGELNKAAAKRARKLSVVLRKSLKEFREISVAHDRSRVRSTKKNVSLSDEINFVVDE